MNLDADQATVLAAIPQPVQGIYYSQSELDRQDEIAEQVNQQVAKYGLRIARLESRIKCKPMRQGMAWGIWRYDRQLVNTDVPQDNGNHHRVRWFLQDACELAYRIAHIAKSWQSWDLEQERLDA